MIARFQLRSIFMSGLLATALGTSLLCSPSSAMGFKGPGTVPREEAIQIPSLEVARVKRVSVYVTDPTADDSHGHIGFRISYHSKLTADDVELGMDSDNVGLVETKPFGQYIAEHFPQKRGMTTYSLTLDLSQTQSLVEDLNGYIQEGTGPYNLYFNNCANYVVRIISRVLDEPITGLDTSMPEKVPGLLMERHLVTGKTHEGGYPGAPVTFTPIHP